MRLLIACICLFLCVIPSPILAEKIKSKDTIVILHGIARSSGTMSVMEEFFTNKNYHVINIDYKSREYTLDRLTKNLQKDIKPHTENSDYKIHFIAHSMGGLLVRAYINTYHPKNLGRVVMLGTPNQGSEVADFMQNNILFQSFYGPAGLQLGTDQRSIQKLLGDVDYELGIIAGDRSIDPVSSAILPGKDDGKVSIARTKVKNMTDHIVLHTTHTFMMRNEKVLKQAYHFLQHGKFDHKKKPVFTLNK